MIKSFPFCLLSSFLMLWSFFYSAFAFSGEEIEYRFERLWPRLEQPWHFSAPKGLAIAADGSVYIADTGLNRIQQFSSEGDFIRRWGSKGLGDGQLSFPYAVAMDTDDNIYVVETGNNRIQTFSARGDYIRSWGRNGREDGQFFSPQGIAIAPDGSIYIVDTGNHRIQQFDAEGKYIRQWGFFGTRTGQFDRPRGIAIAPNGNVYITDTNNHRIQQFSAKGDFIRAWGSPGTRGENFFHPTGLAIASNGDVYVANFNRIQQYSASGVFISQWGSTGYENGQFLIPEGVAVAPDGSIYVVESGSQRIQRFTADGEFIQAWESSSSKKGQFNGPNGLAIDPEGNLYVTDMGNHRVQQFDSTGKFIRTWGSKGTKNGRFNVPIAIEVAANGSVYIADFRNHRIQQFNAKGDFIRTWGSFGSKEGQFSHPRDIAIATDGSIYVVESGNHRIQQFSAEGNFIRTWGSEGSEEGQLTRPNSVVVSPNGSLYIADRGNHRIQQFRTNGEFIQAWGTNGSGDGEFQSIKSLAIDSDNNVYASDANDHRIQKFSADGEFIQAWGRNGTGEGQFNSPNGIVIADDGSIYISDTGNNRIQKFVPQQKTRILPTTPNGVTITVPYKAIILAGGGELIGGRTNHIWSGTWRITQKAYKALSRQSFVIHDEIKFLTAGSTQFDLDLNDKFDDLEVASKDSLRRAITEWAIDAKDVVIFLANHGGPGKFQLNSTEILSGDELNSWVSQLEDSIPGKVTVIIEACNSASFFNQLSKSKRNLLASAKADQPAVISNDGLSSFSYFLWSEIGTGALLKNAFEDARQAMSPIIIDGLAQNAQADADGDFKFTQQDLEALGDYCLGNCNQTAATAPVITPINPKSQTLNGETGLDFSIKVDHLQALNRVWALVQRPDDISIDPNQALNFASIKLSCDTQDICQGRYEQFDLAGEYRISFYAMDDQYEVSFPEIMTITQTQGKAVIPAVYDDQLAVVYLRDVLVDGQHLQAALELQGSKFVVITFSKALKEYSPAAQFDTKSGLLKVPHALAFGSDYQATFKYLGDLEFELVSASPK